MVKRVAGICCVSVAGLLAACGGSQPNGDPSESGESSASFNAAGAPDVDGDASQTGTEPPPRIFHQPAVLPGAQELPEQGIVPAADPRPEEAVPIRSAAQYLSRQSDIINQPAIVADGASGHGSVFGGVLAACPPWCAQNTQRAPISTSAVQPRATTP